MLGWRPAVPFGVPHATFKDDIYGDYGISKGTTVVINTAEISMDEEYFPQADTLNPSRFLPASDPRFDPALQGEPFPSKYRQAGFGAEMGKNTAKIALAKLLWAFNIFPVDGEVYDTTNFVSAGLIRRPARFKCHFKIRSEKHREVLEREFVEAEKVLEEFPLFE